MRAGGDAYHSLGGRARPARMSLARSNSTPKRGAYTCAHSSKRASSRRHIHAHEGKRISFVEFKQRSTNTGGEGEKSDADWDFFFFCLLWI